jgi:hypothetical protein
LYQGRSRTATTNGFERRTKVESNVFMNNPSQNIAVLQELARRWGAGETTRVETLNELALWEDSIANPSGEELDAAWELRRQLEESVDGDATQLIPVQHLPPAAAEGKGSEISSSVAGFDVQRYDSVPQLRDLKARLVAARKRRAWEEFEARRNEVEATLAGVIANGAPIPHDLQDIYKEADEAREADALVAEAIEVRKRGDFSEAARLLAEATRLDSRAPRLSSEQQQVSDLTQMLHALRSNLLITAEDLAEADRLCEQLLDDDAAPANDYIRKRHNAVTQAIEKRADTARRYIQEGEGALARSESIEDKLAICVTMEEKLAELALLMPDSPDLPALRFRLSSLRRQLEQKRLSSAGFTPTPPPQSETGSVPPAASTNVPPANPTVSTPPTPTVPRQPPPLPRPLAANLGSHPHAAQGPPPTIRTPHVGYPPPQPPNVLSPGSQWPDEQGVNKGGKLSGFQWAEAQTAPTQSGRVYKVPVTEATPAGWGLWMWWVIATSISLGIGLLGSNYLGGEMAFSSYAIIMGLLIGLATGIAQWLVLRPHLNYAGWWVLASMLGWAIGVFIVSIPTGSPPNFTVIGAIPWALAAGVIIGLGQWLILVRQVRGAGWWLLASAAGWAVFLSAAVMSRSYYYFAHIIDLYSSGNSGGDLLILADRHRFMAIVTAPIGAAITGAVLVRLLRRRIP